MPAAAVSATDPAARQRSAVVPNSTLELDEVAGNDGIIGKKATSSTEVEDEYEKLLRSTLASSSSSSSASRYRPEPGTPAAQREEAKRRWVVCKYIKKGLVLY